MHFEFNSSLKVEFKNCVLADIIFYLNFYLWITVRFYASEMSTSSVSMGKMKWSNAFGKTSTDPKAVPIFTLVAKALTAKLATNLMVKATVDKFNHAALIGRVGWLFERINNGNTVITMMVCSIKAAFSIDVERSTTIESHFALQFWINHPRMLYSGLWNCFGNFGKAKIVACH